MDTPNKISIIILAAGLSQRFNGNKLLVEIDEIPLVRKTVEIYMENDPYEIIIVVGYEQEKIKSALKGLNVKFALNEKFKEGQSTSVIKGILSTNKHSDGYLFGLADQPFISKELIKKIIDSFYLHEGKETLIVAPFVEEQRGNPVLFSASLRQKLLNISGDQGARDIYAHIQDKFPSAIERVNILEKKTFYDLDTEEDFKNFLLN
ncbi:MAG: nucleotidyltransferase family protein [Nitrospinota bacterium]|nr:nucleotidyltransferase family protein [Nitrospinota bacterium]